MSSFFRMDRTARRFLLTLLLLSALSFLPLWRGVYVAGMSLFGWWMVGLMVLSPIGALVIFLGEHRRKGGTVDPR